MTHECWIPRAARCALAVVLLATVAAGCGAREAAHEEDHHEEAEAAEAAIELSPAAIANAGLRLGRAAPATIATIVEAPGEVHLDAERVLELRPRYPGIVRELRKRVGDRVRAGEVVAIVESNESLSEYEVPATLGGVVLDRPVVTGSAVTPETPLMTIADLSSVWADFAIYPQWVGKIRPGLAVEIVAHNHPELVGRGTIRYVGPLLEQDTRISSARVVLDNARGRWTPGLFVTARVELERARVAVAVPEAAVVRTTEGPAVFVAEGLRFTLRTVTTGRSDGRSIEIVRGLAAGDSVVVENAFVLKSERSKGEAGHEH